MSIDAISSLASHSASPAMLAAARAPGAGGRSSPEDIKKAAQQFEAILVRQLLAPAVEPMMNSQVAGAGGSGGGVYGFMLTDVLANSISQGGGLGLASMFQAQLSPPVAPDAMNDTHESSL